MKDEVEKVLEEDVRPVLAMHGGGVELIDVSQDNVVRVKLTGGCAGCPMAQMTILVVVERTLKLKIPGLKRVELG